MLVSATTHTATRPLPTPCPAHLRNSSRSPDCAIETRVLVKDVPTLTPMMMGTEARTVSTVGALRQPAAPTPHHPGRGGALTLGGHHADHDGGGRAGALHQDRDQHTNDQSSQGVGQHHVILEDVSSYFACAQETGILRLGRAGRPPARSHLVGHSLLSSWKAELRMSREQMKR